MKQTVKSVNRAGVDIAIEQYNAALAELVVFREKQVALETRLVELDSAISELAKAERQDFSSLSIAEIKRIADENSSRDLQRNALSLAQSQIERDFKELNSNRRGIDAAIKDAKDSCWGAVYRNLLCELDKKLLKKIVSVGYMFGQSGQSTLFDLIDDSCDYELLVAVAAEYGVPV